jgi:predicted secreted protein
LAVVDKNNVTQQASWVIPQNATNYTYILGTTNLGRIIGTNFYATYSYASIDISDLNKFAVSIGKF